MAHPRLLVALAAFAVLASAASAQVEPTTLVRWEFKADTEGWYPAHSMAELEVRDGVLHGAVTDHDPYMICGPGHSFDLQANDYQAVLIRAMVKQSGPAEFFWASSVEGKDLGFVAGKEIAFNMIADGRFHSYHVFPLWQDRVTRLRFDPPGGAGQEVWIDYIAIVQFAPPETVPARPRWDFERGLEGFVPQSDIESFELREGRVTLTALAGQQPTLLSPPLDGDPDAMRFLAVRAAMEGVGDIVVALAHEDTKFEPRRLIVVPAVADGQMRTYLVETAPGLDEGRAIKRLRLAFTATSEPARIIVDSVALSARPTGPPEMSVTLAPHTPTLFAGRRRKFTVSVQNVGGDEIGPLQVTVSSPAFTPAIVTAAGAASLAPGERWAGSLWVEADAAGAGGMTTRVTAPPAAPVEFETNLVVSHALRVEDLPHVRKATAVLTDEVLWISNAAVGLALARNGYQGSRYGPGLLCMWDEAWKPVATIPGMFELTGVGEGARGTPQWPQQALIHESGGGVALVEFRDAHQLGEVTGLAKVFVRLRDDAPDFEVTAIFTPWNAGGLLRFEGPRLLAGDGTFGGEQEQALFPGLEWLVRGEKSSSTLDIAPPGNVRYAPHPNRITVPLMAVQAPDGGVVGLMWEALGQWDGGHNRPAAVFASPNFLDHQDNSLMALSLPSIPEWSDENSLLAARPYQVSADRPLVLRQRIFAFPKGSVLDAVRLWYDRYGTPPLPDLPRTYRDAAALSIRSYEEVLYVEDKGWMGVLGWAPGNSPGVALHYVVAQQVLGNDTPYPDLARRALDRVGSRRDLDLAAHVGDSLEPLLALRGQAYGIMSSQDAAGGWYFEPDEEHRPLGQPGLTTLGTVASKVAAMLQAARIFHDDRLLAAGLKGLAFMEQFEVPRGAQVWEVPLHTPDILAAAHGVDAYLAGYLATGERRHLDRAVYWALAGLPFLYVWQAPEPGLEAMLYGSIPVFGATWYVGSWFGRLVQWNGLAYAASLQRLAPHDRSLDWRHIAEGVTRSGIIQQRLEPKYLGLYPDSISMIDGEVSWGLMLGPQLILDNLFPLMGRNLEPHIETPMLAEGPVTLLAAGKPGDVLSGPDWLRFSVDYPAGEWAYATVVGVSEPAAVAAGGANLGRVSQFGDGAGYRYDATIGAVEIKARRSAAPVSIEVGGVRVFRGEGARTQWDFATGPQGWHAMHSLAPLEVRDGIASTHVTGDDPFMGVLGLNASTEQFGGVRIRMRTAGDGPAELFFGAGGFPIRAGSSRTFQAQGGDFREYVVDLRDHPGWTGTATALRIDPPGQPGDVVGVASVALIPRAAMQ